MKYLYYHGPSAYSSVQRLYKYARRIKPQIRIKDVEKWLRSQDAYTLHRPANRRLRAEPRVYVKGIDRQWAMDLCDMTKIERFNENMKYILTCIDVFSKFAWAVPLKNKSATAVSDAFRTILGETNRRPRRIETDKGKEFYNVQFRRVCNDIGAHHFSSNSRHKSAVVERFNRTLKEILYKMFTHNRNVNWVNNLSSALTIYNNRYHRSIKMAPSEVNAGNQAQVYNNLFAKKPRQGKIYEKGQLVRISKIKMTFEKGYLPRYTEEVFRISEVHLGRPNRYTLEDLMGELIEGKFVAEEITPVSKGDDDLWLVEKVIKRDRAGRLFVKWLGFPPKFNSWVDSIAP